MSKNTKEQQTTYLYMHKYLHISALESCFCTRTQKALFYMFTLKYYMFIKHKYTYQ